MLSVVHMKYFINVHNPDRLTMHMDTRFQKLVDLHFNKSSSRMQNNWIVGGTFDFSKVFLTGT